MRRLVLLIMVIAIVSVFASCSNKSKQLDKEEMKLEFASEHFNFYSENKYKNHCKKISEVLEKNHKKITDNLKIQSDEKTNIYVYSDLDSFHEAIGQPNASEWMVGAEMGNNVMKMVSPYIDKSKEDYMIKVAIHEFTHVLVRNINKEVVPNWLNEGIATFEANQMDDSIKKFIKSNQVPKIMDLENMGAQRFGDNGGYAYSYSIVEFIINQYGYDDLVDLIKSPKDFEKILGLSQDEFQNKWEVYLKSKYNN